MPDWPWPNDSRDDRLRRIIDHYRTALSEVDPAACRAVDDRMIEYGQRWVCDDHAIIDVNEMLSAKDIAERFGLAVWDVYNWERMGFYSGVKRNGRKFYRLGDVLKAKSGW